MDIADRLRRPLVSHSPPEAIPDPALRRMLVDDRSDALVEIVRLRAALRQIADAHVTFYSDIAREALAANN